MKFLNGLDRFIGAVCGVTMAIMMLLVLQQVLFRYVLKIPSPATQEIAIYCMVYVAMLGSVLAIRHKTHVAVNFVVDRLPPRFASAVRIISYLIVIAFFVILFWQGCKLTQRATFQHSTTTGITVAYIMVSIPISAVLSIIFTLEHLVHEIRGLGRGSTDSTESADAADTTEPAADADTEQLPLTHPDRMTANEEENPM